MRNFEKSLQISLHNLQSFGRLFFSSEQLYYAVCRNSRLHFPIFNKVSALVTTPKTFLPPISWKEFEEKFKDYRQENKIEGLLKIENEIKFAAEFPNDLTLYGLPKVLICESAEIAQMLRANQFHLQTPCGVLSLSEANPLPESFQKMLSRAEEPQIFFLHNANLSALTTIKNLRNTLQIGENISLRPIGLRPIHAMRLHLFANKFGQQDFDFSEFTYLNEDEKKWLRAGNSAEVAAVPPVRLLRVLRRLILGLESLPKNWRVKLPKKNLGFM